ncbi:trimeric intracellular cation channel family protein [Natronorubrum aibiense]|uniref:Trimeric intracellular cation channel family protein n=2 Tax=Natronorubrum aibiense TaxID=348826 RepID=A0A5P9P662_9EURY|nr:TRIC cation channel family protein [Natronorubrum aibiense]QFU83628.1 trimeric intracellular cation channel family protein [Natronorubrum aibiense]
MARDFVGVLLADPFVVMNTIGLVAFALVGATKAIREEFDLFGIAVVGLATAFAGGITRDLLVNRLPLALRSLGEISLGVLGISLAIGLYHALESPDDHPITLVSDAVGLAAFTTAGAIVATETGVSGFGVVAIGTINAVGGGALADVLLDRAPFILFEDFYASCAVLGAATYWLVGTLSATGSTAAAMCAAVTVGTRLVAVTYGWRLPTAQTLESIGGDVGKQ